MAAGVTQSDLCDNAGFYNELIYFSGAGAITMMNTNYNGIAAGTVLRVKCYRPSV